jgi:homocysteine S-methyltransferase
MISREETERSDPFLKRLADGPILADGAMGTVIYSRGISFGHCFDELNLSRPDLINSIHREYIEAGAEIIETNTFGANYGRLQSHGYEEKVRDINLMGVKVARNAREICGRSVFIGGSIGPLGKSLRPFGQIQDATAFEYFLQQAEALLEGGVDLFIIETMSSLGEIEQAMGAVKKLSNLPVIAMMSFTEAGTTFLGHYPEEAARLLTDLGADVIGANCSTGPQRLLDIANMLRQSTDKPLSIMPNAGMPRYVEGRFHYGASPGYFADYALHLLNAGVSIIGGCCGTTPDHVKSMAAVISDYSIHAVEPSISVKLVDREVLEKADVSDVHKSSFVQKLGKEFVVSVELDPPRGTNPEKLLKAARRLEASGIDAVNIADSPMARVRMSALALAYLLKQHVDLEIILHFTCRDRNLMGLQSDLMGAHAVGIKNILAITGDPPSAGDYPNATAVYDVDSIGLVEIIRKLNSGTDLAGSSVGKPTEFSIGVGADPSVEDPDHELSRLQRKVDAGAQFVFTQPLYELDVAERFVNMVAGLNVPILLGLLPLQSYRHAEFLHNEVPGIRVPDEHREQLRRAGKQANLKGIAMCRELLKSAKDVFAGVYLMPSFGRYDTILDILDGIVQPQRRTVTKPDNSKS